MTDTPTPGTPSTEAGLFTLNSADIAAIEVEAARGEAARAAAAERDAEVERLRTLLREAVPHSERFAHPRNDDLSDACLMPDGHTLGLHRRITAALSASPAPAAPEIDVERLSDALHAASPASHFLRQCRLTEFHRLRAERIAAEYARLRDT